MAEGTHIRELDTHLGVHEKKLSELQDGLTKTRAKVTKQITDLNMEMSQRMDGVGNRMDKMDQNFVEIKQLLMGLQNNNKGMGDSGSAPVNHGTASTLSSTQTNEVHMEDKKMCSEGKELVLVQVVCSRPGQRESCFYVVDLEANKACKTPVATLLNEDGGGAIVRLGSLIYNVGGETLPELNPYQDSDHHIHRGTSFLELSKPHLLSLLNQEGDVRHDYDDPSNSGSGGSMRWKGAPCMNHDRLHPGCASLGGKIYVLGGSGPARPPTSCFGQEFMPQCGEWNSFFSPPNDLPLQRFRVSSPVIPDEKNQRLLVHFKTARALYAYYPANGNWELLAPNFWHWFPATALVDGVLYSHVEGIRDCLVAYDLMTKSWLKVGYSTYFPEEVCISEFSNMLHLGSGMLCLANFAYTPHLVIKLEQTRFQFIKFRVERTTPTEVLVTPGAINCFPYENHLYAINFIAL